MWENLCCSRFSLRSRIHVYNRYYYSYRLGHSVKGFRALVDGVFVSRIAEISHIVSKWSRRIVVFLIGDSPDRDSLFQFNKATIAKRPFAQHTHDPDAKLIPAL